MSVDFRVESLSAVQARVSTGRSGSGADWVFVDGGVVKVSWLGGVSENVGFNLERTPMLVSSFP